MAVGLLISPYEAPEDTIKRVHDMGFTNCFLSLDGYINKFTPDAAKQIGTCWRSMNLVATTVEVVGPPPLVWNFLKGPSTIGLVPPKTRAARIDALRQVSDFAKLLGIPQVQTHCGFIPEDPADALYPGSGRGDSHRRAALPGERPVFPDGDRAGDADHDVAHDSRCGHAESGSRTRHRQPDSLRQGESGRCRRYSRRRTCAACTPKDGKWPTDPSKLGEEVLIGKGLVDFKTVFTKLHKLGYTGAITIERETSGPQQIEDVKNEKIYLERILSEVMA